MRRVCTGPERGCREGGLRGGMCCSVGAVGHLCAIFNSVSKSEAELNMVFVIRCGAGGSGNGVHAVGVGLGMCVCTGGDQTACVPTLASMGTRRFESWSIIWGKKNCIISPRWGAVCRARCVQGEVQAVAPCDLSRSRAPQHSPPTAWFKGRCGVKGGHSVGCDPGARCTWGARWVEGG